MQPHRPNLLLASQVYLTKKARKKFLSSAGPVLLVLTFAEDGLRIFLRWGEQYHYMISRMGMGWFLASAVLLVSAAVQLVGAALVARPRSIKPSRVKPACYMLLGFTTLQPFMYGQATDADFMCRSITLAGGFLLLIWSENEVSHPHCGRCRPACAPLHRRGRGRHRAHAICVPRAGVSKLCLQIAERPPCRVVPWWCTARERRDGSGLAARTSRPEC